MDRREQLIGVFLDTISFCEENEILRNAVDSAKMSTVLYEADEYPALPAKRDIAREKNVILQGYRTFEAATKLHVKYPDKKITVLNFASATHPGGGVKRGSSAQEESLCRCSTLFPALDQQHFWGQYYNKNYHAHSQLYSDAIIYTPNVVICKTDDSVPQRLEESEFVTVDVITCAAPNLRRPPGNSFNRESSTAVNISPAELLALHKSRAKHILHIAAVNSTDILVLGAFGCGAFRNDPNVVANAYAEVLPEYRYLFDRVAFAIHCRNGEETPNYKAFKAALNARNLL